MDTESTVYKKWGLPMTQILRRPLDLIESDDPAPEDPTLNDPDILEEIELIDSQCDGLLSDEDRRYALFGGICDDTANIRFAQAIDPH